MKPAETFDQRLVGKVQLLNAVAIGPLKKMRQQKQILRPGAILTGFRNSQNLFSPR